jgi:predicted nucleic acid-binding protein
VARYILVDTDILIDASREIDEALDTLRQIESDAGLAISVITELARISGTIISSPI